MRIKKIKLPFQAKKTVLGLGSQTKNTLCLLQGNLAYLSPIHQDLNQPHDFFSFEKDVKFFLKNRPKIIAYDLHPEYQSSKYSAKLQASAAGGTGCKLQAVQHHHAHIIVVWLRMA